MTTPDAPPDVPLPKVRIGISSCLLGEEVRFDGGHKRDRYLTDTLSGWFEYVPICPEVGIGMSTPRPPIRLVRIEDQVRVRGVKDPSADFTDALSGYVGTVSGQIDTVSGYILKRASPSCGMERVKVYGAQGAPLAGEPGAGAFAGALMNRYPRLPIEEEGRLSDPILRENFIERVFVYDRLRALLAEPSPGALVDFHTRHKLLALAHGQPAYRALGRLVADAGADDPQRAVERYAYALMTALRRRATRRSHVNVLQHLMGYLKTHLDVGDKTELLEVIEAYRLGRLPLIVPLVLLKHHFRRHPHEYVAKQAYLDPHPAELMLRNHV